MKHKTMYATMLCLLCAVFLLLVGCGGNGDDLSDRGYTLYGAPIYFYQIVVGDDVSESEATIATRVQKELFDLCGKEISIVPSDAAETEYEILLGNCGRGAAAPKENTYTLTSDGKKITARGTGELANTYAVLALLNDLSNAEADADREISVRSVQDAPFVFSSYTEINLPEQLEDYTDAYNIDFQNNGNVLERFYRASNELPEEITVLERVSYEDYPLSMARQCYVSPTARADGIGTKEDPYTLQEAIQKFSDGQGGILWLMGGTYDVTSGISFPSAFSGNPAAPLFLQSCPGEAVVFTTGRSLEPETFAPVSDADAVAARLPEAAKDHVLSVDLGALGWSEKDLGKMGTTGGPLLYIDGTAGVLARYPNDGEDLLYFNRVYETGSVVDRDGSNLYAGWAARMKSGEFDHMKDRHFVDKFGNLNMDYGWVVNLVDLTPASWVDTGNIYYYGNVFEGWEFAYYTVHFSAEEKKIWSDNGSTYGAKVSGNSPSGYNSYYLMNAIEALDQPGEWFLDRETDILYLYPTENFADAVVRFSASETDVFSLNRNKYLVLDGISFADSNGKGIYADGCDNVLIQNCVFRNLSVHAIQLRSCLNSAVIYNDCSQIKGAMIQNTAGDHNYTLKAQRNVFQNNYCHDPYYSIQGGINTTGYLNVISHNLLEDTNIGLTGAFESVVEYNDIKGGSRDTSDSGMIYLVRYNNLGNHIRYNYIRSLHYSGNAVYFDDLSSCNYMYYNIVDSTQSKRNKAFGFGYSSSGHYNVFYGNICVGRLEDHFNESCLYFDNSSHLGYRFAGFSQGMATAYNTKYNKEVISRRFPEWMRYLELMNQHIAERGEADYVRNELEIYLRSPANNIFKNNVVLGTSGILTQTIQALKNSVTGQNMVTTDLIDDNYHNRNYRAILENYDEGDFTVSAEMLHEVKEAVPEFVPLDISNVGPVEAWYGNETEEDR